MSTVTFPHSASLRVLMPYHLAHVEGTRYEVCNRRYQPIATVTLRRTQLAKLQRLGCRFAGKHCWLYNDASIPTSSAATMQALAKLDVLIKARLATGQGVTVKANGVEVEAPRWKEDDDAR